MLLTGGNVGIETLRGAGIRREGEKGGGGKICVCVSMNVKKK